MKLIPLTQGRVAMVDDQDYERLMEFKWHYNQGYAMRQLNKRRVTMATFILDIPTGMLPDHIDRDRLNNQRSNLRIATVRENSYNQRKRQGTSSQYKGVARDYRANKWKASIESDGRSIHLGMYRNERAAAAAYDIAALLLFGEFAAVNFQ